MSLYDIAQQVCHEHGSSWTDPRTGVTYPPPVSLYDAFTPGALAMARGATERAWNEAIEACIEQVERGASCIGSTVERLRALRRDTDKPEAAPVAQHQSAEVVTSEDEGASPSGSPPAPSSSTEDRAIAAHDRPRDYALTDAEVLERGAAIMERAGRLEAAAYMRGAASDLRAQAAREADDLTQEEKLRRLLIRAEEAIQFMTGSIDFGPGGQAHDGFMRLVHPLRKEIHDAVREAPDQPKAAREADPFEAAAGALLDELWKKERGATSREEIAEILRARFGPWREALEEIGYFGPSVSQSVYDRVREIARRALAGGPRP